MSRGRQCALARITLEEPVEPLAVLLGRAQRKYAVAENARAVDHKGKAILQIAAHARQKDVTRPCQVNVTAHRPGRMVAD